MRDIYLAFDEKIAYTTLMTTLDRLFKKKLLTRRKDGRAFSIWPPFHRMSLNRGSGKMSLMVCWVMAQTKCSPSLPASLIPLANEIASCLMNSIA